jgi:hypothetical protein
MGDTRPRSLGQRIGRRGAALLFFALLDAVYCYGLIAAPRPLAPFYVWMDHLMPLAAWAVCWGIVGVICLGYAFRLHDSLGFMFAVALKVGWGLMALLGWFAGAIDRGYVSAVIWLAFAGFVYLIAGGIPSAPPRPPGRWSWIR